jgi:hypothetical protein
MESVLRRISCVLKRTMEHSYNSSWNCESRATTHFDLRTFARSAGTAYASLWLVSARCKESFRSHGRNGSGALCCIYPVRLGRRDQDRQQHGYRHDACNHVQAACIRSAALPQMCNEQRTKCACEAPRCQHKAVDGPTFFDPKWSAVKAGMVPKPPP